MNQLSLVPAGAGAGKTYHIQQTLADWVESKTIAPGRILAVTFTEAAASELRERVRRELMERGRIDDALDIDHAYIGTIHALGQRLLTEHAFAAGRAPKARLLSEPERDLLIRQEMTRCTALAPLMSDLARFGYRWNFLTDATAEETFRSDLLQTVDLLRGLGARGTDPAILEPALAALSQGYGTPAPDGAPLTAALQNAVNSLLKEFTDSLGPLFAGKVSVRKDFDSDHANLRRAARSDALEWDWRLWQKLRKLRVSNSSSRTPDGYDELAQTIIEAAASLPRHPGPLADAQGHLIALVHGAQQVLDAYQTAKRRAGLIDYADMIVESEALLRERPEILAAVSAEIDCVVIDEFQDTNPVQFALLWRLAQSAPRALMVGDTKQSIMGFQGADPRLTDALNAARPECVSPLDRNWRSDPRIMAFVNTLGQALFPEGYIALLPQQPESDDTALEIVQLPGGRKDTSPDCIANRIVDLLGDDVQILDKNTEQMRVARPSDIAVLCYTHDKGSAVAAALEARGLPVRIQQPGWLSSPAMRAARAALAFAADPDDLHAALTWLTLGPAALPLCEALKRAADGELHTHDALVCLRGFTPDIDTRPVAETLAGVLAASGSRSWAAGIADADQAVADLARLEAEAIEFDTMATDLRAAAGFHGCGLQVFLGWIVAQTEKSWDRHPDPDGWSSSGIEVVTWHSAKGREWPITIVAGLDKTIAAHPGTLTADFDHFDDLDDVLRDAGLAFLPDFAALESQEHFTEAQRPEDERAAARALYVALTRARDRLILALPKEKPKRENTERMADLLRDQGGLGIELDGFVICGKKFDARISEGNSEAPEGVVPRTAVVHTSFGEPRDMPTVELTAWRRTPSSLEADPTAPAPTLQTVSIGHGIPETHTNNAAERGTVWHLAFRVAAARPDLIERLPAATGLNPHTCDKIAAQTKALTDWLADQGYHRLHFEVPLQEVRPDGSETNAILDLLAEGPEGFLIVDHKSGPCPEPAVRFEGYRPQLAEYARMVRAKWPDKPINSVAINWMSEGTLTLASLTSDQLT